MLLIVDGTNVVMRYASAMAPIDREATEPEADKIVAAVHRAILACAEETKATHLIVALDSGVGSWRRDIYPAYKHNRTVKTLAWTNRLNLNLSANGIMCVRTPEYEADDIIATLAKRTALSGRFTVVLSGDSDLLQLSSLSCVVYQFGKSPEPKFVARTMAWVREKYEIASAGHLVLYKALVGETGDGLPGVPGIGPVKAKRLLDLAPALDDIPKMLKGEVEDEAYRLALTLVTLRTDVPIPPIHPHDCRINPQRMMTP